MRTDAEADGKHSEAVESYFGQTGQTEQTRERRTVTRMRASARIFPSGPPSSCCALRVSSSTVRRGVSPVMLI